MGLESGPGHSRHFDRAPLTSDLPPISGHSQGHSACLKGASSGNSFRVALAIRQRTLGLTKQHRARLWPTTSCWLRHVSGSAHPRIWYSSLADLTPRIDPYSVVIGSARRSEFQSKLACPPEGLRRITRRERHGSGYVRKASASRGGKHR
jgi:hypothetical protein